MAEGYVPQKSDKFTFGLWTVGNTGRDTWGDAVRPPLDPVRSLSHATSMRSCSPAS